MVRLLAISVLALAGCASGQRPAGPAPDEPEASATDAPPPRRDSAAPTPDAAPSALPDVLSQAPDAAATALADTGPTTAGCGTSEGLPEGQATITVGGVNRTYILRLPAGYSAQRAWPLVLALHPNGGAGIGFWDATSGARSIRALARDKAVVVLPLALPAGGGFDWRGHLDADLAFFDALIQRLESKLCIDRARLFAMGFSGGGSFSGVLGCRRSDIRAFAAGSGVAYYDPKDCIGHPAAWLTVGADELIPARAAFRDDWVQRAGCQPMTTATPPASCLAYQCPAATPVHHCVHPGGHLWPDYGTQAAWDFFARF
jgi:polyhydroxybutyrate depolymerase